jgi:hypothetical protein
MICKEKGINDYFHARVQIREVFSYISSNNKRSGTGACPKNAHISRRVRCWKQQRRAQSPKNIVGIPNHASCMHACSHSQLADIQALCAEMYMDEVTWR